MLGKLLSLGAVTNIGVGILIYLSASLLNFTQIYLLIGCLIMAAGFWGLFQDPTNRDIIPQNKKIVFRKKYWLYYFLTFMAGARRQIFMAFAVFLMVKKFHFTVQEVTTLFVINNMWMIDYRIPFIGGAVFSFVSLMVVQKIQTQR